MVIAKPPTKHGLDRKYKPWRRGKSEKSNKRSSLKQQLRGLERLLQKLPDEDTTRREELQTKIRALQLEIEDKQKVLLEKKNAEKAHGQRFLDRQRLTRLERTARKLNDNDKTRESELLKIALDQVYVAHHPTDVKYMPLFRKGERVIDTSRQLYRRAVTRRRILRELAQTKERAAWIAQDQYDRLPKEEWTIQDEERIFGGTITRQGLKEIKQQKLQASTEDSRFAMAPQHQAVLQAAEQLEAELEEEENESSSDASSSDGDEGAIKAASRQKEQKTTTKIVAKNDEESEDSSHDSDSDDSDSDDVDPLKRLEKGKTSAQDKGQVKKIQEKSESSDSSSSDSDFSDEDEKADREQKIVNRVDRDDSDTSDDSSDDEEVNDAKTENAKRKLEDQKTQPGKHNNGNDDDEDDDFLMDTKDDEDDENVFSMTLKQVPALGEVRGDKSQGWATQRQRPGQFKKRRERR